MDLGQGSNVRARSWQAPCVPRSRAHEGRPAAGRENCRRAKKTPPYFEVHIMYINVYINSIRPEASEWTGKPSTTKAPWRHEHHKAGFTYYVLGLVLCCHPVRPLRAFFRQRRFPYDRYLPLPIPLDATCNGSAALAIQFRLIVVRNTSDRGRCKQIT